MARQMYKNRAGKRLPSVTTILSRFKESGGLLYWANQQGLDGKTLQEARTPAATSGTMAHSLVEAHINGWELPDLQGPADVVGNARAAFETYLKWQDMTKLEIRHTEVSLVSEKHQYGGMLDAIGVIGNELVMVDWKTSNSVYADYLLQLAGYSVLWAENYPEHELVGGFHLCRFAKEQGDFAHHYYPRLEEEVECFLAMRDLYDRVKRVEKRAK